jgi:hypothetical protein
MNSRQLKKQKTKNLELILAVAVGMLCALSAWMKVLH